MYLLYILLLLLLALFICDPLLRLRSQLNWTTALMSKVMTTSTSLVVNSIPSQSLPLEHFALWSPRLDVTSTRHHFHIPPVSAEPPCPLCLVYCTTSTSYTLYTVHYFHCTPYILHMVYYTTSSSYTLYTLPYTPATLYSTLVVLKLVFCNAPP